MSIDYAQGTSREVKEELRIRIPGEELELVDKRTVNFTDQSGFPNRMHIRTYRANYRRIQHGRIKINKSELKKAKFKSPEFIRKSRMLYALGQDYEVALMAEIETTSHNIKNSRLYSRMRKGFYRALKNMANIDIAGTIRRILY